jgi:hypothetical protein
MHFTVGITLCVTLRIKSPQLLWKLTEARHLMRASVKHRTQAFSTVTERLSASPGKSQFFFPFQVLSTANALCITKGIRILGVYARRFQHLSFLGGGAL